MTMSSTLELYFKLEKSMRWTIEYIRDGLALSTEVIASSLSAAFVASFELEEDPSVEVLDVYMAENQ